MTVVSVRTAWINDKFFLQANPALCTITKVEKIPQAKNPLLMDYRMTFRNANGDEGTMDVYGDNLNLLIKHQNDDDKWTGLDLAIALTEVNGKKRKVFRAIR
jgi:hypothetical protein